MKTRKRRHHVHHYHRTTQKTQKSRRIKHKNDASFLRVNNFYLWANNKWLKEVPKTLPRELKYIRPLDNFKLIQDEMFRNVLTMVREYTRTNTKIAHQMKNIVTSFRDLHPEPILGHIM